MAGAMPSTLYQKVKFMVEAQFINVATKDNIVATLTTFDFYINVDENVVECSFQSLKVVIATFVGIDKKILTP